MTRIALCQRFSKMGDVQFNCRTMANALRETDADLVVFPEVFLSGYVIRDALFQAAETVPGPSVEHLAEVSREQGKALLFGMARRDAASSGYLRNSAVYISKDGKASVYDKTRPVNFGPFEERFYFAPGRDLPLWELDGMKFGCIICYDIFFPELAKRYALMGADMVVCISASPSVTRPFFEKVMEARAIENTIYLAYANAVGTQGNLVFWGGDAFVGPRGGVISRGKYYEEDTVTGKIDPDALRVARENRPTLRDSLDPVFSGPQAF